jgi:hypothetical protein
MFLYWVSQVLFCLQLHIDLFSSSERNTYCLVPPLTAYHTSTIVSIRWGTVVLHLWGNVAASVEKASRMCNLGSSEEARRIWDEAFSLYAGSKADETDFGGYFLFNLAQIQCKKYGTCKKGYMASVNLEITENFLLGKNRLLEGKCDAVIANAKRIRTLMIVPLLQGTMKAAYELDLEDDVRQRIQGEASAFVTSIVPIVASCSRASANTIYNDLAPGKAPGASYEVIKFALERTYDCLGITCADVGGLVNLRGDGYLPRAEPCGMDIDTSKDDSEDDENNFSHPSTPSTKYKATMQSGTHNAPNLPLALGLSFGIVIFLALAVSGGYYWRSRQKEFDTANTSGKPRSSASDTSDESYEDGMGDKHII